MLYRAVCFDFDYTLADATDAIVAGFQHAFPLLGHPAPDRETVRGTIGLLLEDAYHLLTGDCDPARTARFRPLFLEVAKPRQIAETTLFPGCAELLKGLRAEGVSLGIVSTKISSTIELVMQRHGLLDTLDFVLGSNHVSRPKPDPEGLLLALDRMGRDAFLYCGDTVMDAGAARDAGVDFCAVLNGTTPRAAFAAFPHVFAAENLWQLGHFLGIAPCAAAHLQTDC